MRGRGAGRASGVTPAWLEVEKGLGNNAQRAAFRANAGQLGFALRGQAETYELEQTNVYGRSVLNGGMSIAAQEAATAYDNPDRVRASIAQIGVLGNELLDRYDGLSGNEAGDPVVEARVREEVIALTKRFPIYN